MDHEVDWDLVTKKDKKSSPVKLMGK